MKREPRFGALILTHGRAGRVLTYNALRRHGYTGPIYLVVDDEDEQRPDYEREYPGEVVVFSKREAAAHTDAALNIEDRRSVVFARNWSWQIARGLGLDYFWQLDDDYSSFDYRLDRDYEFLSHQPKVRDLDAVIRAALEYMQRSRIDGLSFAQTGDYIGGDNSGHITSMKRGRLIRKVMNTFVFATARPQRFKGLFNDDVNLYVSEGNRGRVFVMQPMVQISQGTTQARAGGLTERYVEHGTYVKSFMSVMYAPSCVRVGVVNPVHQRVHHKIRWRNAVPCVIGEEHRKEGR